MVTDPAGNLYVAFLSDAEPEGLEIVSIDAQGRPRWGQRLPESPVDSGRSARLIFRAGKLVAFWLDSGRVIMQEMSSAGEFLGAARPVTADADVESYDIAQNGDEELVLWFGSSSDELGVYALDLVQPDAEKVLIDPEGVLPDVAVDEYGVTHAVWMTAPAIAQDTQIRYQAYPPGYLHRADHPTVIETEFSTTDEIEPATLAIDRYYGYIFWTTIIHTGLRAGSIDSLYISFPLIDPPDQHAGILLFPTAFEFTYDQQDPAAGLRVGPRAAWNEMSPGSDQMRELIAAPSLLAETGVIFRPRVLTRSGQTQAQIGAFYFADGVVESYQLLTFTNTGSLHPNLLIDDGGYLYASWLELTDVRQYSVYIATSNPSFRETFDQLTSGDYIRMIGDTTFGLVSGVILIPIAFLWMILPLASLGLTSILRRNETRFLAPGHLVSLALAIGIYWYLKLGIFPNLRLSVPLVQWIPIIPVSWYTGLQIAIPLLGSVFALLLTAWIMRRTERTSPAVAFIIYGLVDGVFTVAFYGGSLFGM